MEKKSFLLNSLNSLRRSRGFLILLVAASLLIVTLSVLYYFAYEGIQMEAKHRAEGELRETGLRIKNIMSVVEVAEDNIAWAVESDLADPDGLFQLLEKFVKNNDNIIGAGIGFVADYYPSKGRWFEPYVVKHGDGSLSCKQIGSVSHDYLKMDWFVNTVAIDSAKWSEPYFDESGAKTLVATYTRPIHDASGRIVAVLGADVSLDWLSHVINGDAGNPLQNVLLSRTGQILACPVESLVMRKNAYEVSRNMSDTMASEMNRRMLAGESGQITVRNNDGEKTYAYFAPVDEQTGWSMAVICKDKDIYRGLRSLGFGLLLLMLFGLGILGFIMWRAAKQLFRMQKIHSEKERISSELRIASGIQQSMIPKTYPPYPDRDDVEIYGALEPAKEVGGDLYDFYIRDEKLFFCIGDVSGKGVPASLVMAVTRSQFRTVSAHESNAVRIVEVMNESLSNMNETSMFVTLFIGVLDLPTGRLRYCNAGHDAPLLIKHPAGDGSEGVLNQVSKLDVVSNIAIGIVNSFQFEGQETMISPHTTIFLYTDGLTEAENASHQQFGYERIIEVAETMKEGKRDASERSGLEHFLKDMNVAVRHFVGAADQSDDLTMLFIEYKKEQRPVRLKRSITLPNDIQTIPQLNKFVERVAEELGYDMSETMNLNLAIEEAVVNVMNYAYPSGTEGEVHVDAEANDLRLKFVITDKGIPFDPTAKEDADTSLSAEDRPIGGLGIYLVRQLMDSMNYERVNGCNVLTLRKKLNVALQ